MKRVPIPVIALDAATIETIVSTVFPLVESNLEADFYLLAVDFEKEAGAWYLRIYIEGNAATISLNDCERISRRLDPVLETHTLLKDLPYSMEVSSPGLFRPLRTTREFAFYRGRPIRLVATEETTAVKGKQKKAALPLLKEVAHGLLDTFDAEQQTLHLLSDAQPALGKAVSPERRAFKITPDMQVLLNPMIRFPEDSNEPDANESAESDEKMVAALSVESFSNELKTVRRNSDD
jgi:ribosome maturation factor RimP